MRASAFLLAVIVLGSARPGAAAAPTPDGSTGPAQARSAAVAPDEVAQAEASPAQKGKHPADEGEPEKRELRHRTLTIDDATLASLPELHVAGGQPTIITFQQKVKEEGAILSQVGGLFFKPVQTDKTVIVIPKADVKAPVPLNVTLVDGTVLSFKLVSVPSDADVQVDVILALQRRAPPDSAAALKGTIGQLQAQLDECRANSFNAGATKLAALLLGQSLDAPQAFERHSLHKINKSDRLLVEATWAYRLVGLTYVVLTVDNRDPDRPWVLDHAEVHYSGGGQASDVKVLAAQSEFQAVQPGESGRVVVGFQTPGANPGISLVLYERDGNRRAILDNLGL